MCGWSVACDEGFKYGIDDNVFYILGCGFVVYRGEVIFKFSFVWNVKVLIKGNIFIRLYSLRK